MFGNYILIAIRNFFKNKFYSIINIAGLAIGMACTILILLFVIDEISYDKHHENADNIYRLTTHGIIGDNHIESAEVSPPLGQALVEEFPFVLKSTRVKGGWSMSINTEEDSYNEDRFYYADSSVFDIFTIPFIIGNPETALNRPFTVVLTESTAKKYFGQENPVGKKIKGDPDEEFEVTGVIQDCPSNTQFKYDFLASFLSHPDSRDPNFFNVSVQSYVLLSEDYDPARFNEDFQLIISKYLDPLIQQLIGASYEDFTSGGNKWEHGIQPLLDIHLRSEYEDEFEINGDIRYVYIFSIIALFILVIACINFMNLATARSVSRAREVGIRKVAGASRNQLIRQFLGESIILAFVSHIIAMIVVESVLPTFNNFTGKQLFFDYSDFTVYLGLIGIIVLVGILAGSYPAFLMSSFNPTTVLKIKTLNGHKRSWMRNFLVIFQFTISIVIILATIIVNRQLRYLSDINLGFSDEQVLVIRKAYGVVPHHETLKQDLLAQASIQSVTITGAVPADISSASAFYAEGKTMDEAQLLSVGTVDESYLETFGIELMAGRFFREGNSDSGSVVLNEKAVLDLGITGDPIGLKLERPGVEFEATVIGVIKDFNFQSLHHEINPLLLYKGNFNSIAIKFNPENISGTVKTIEKTWSKYTDKAIEYYFLDQKFADQYGKELKTSQLFSVFSILAIFIALLGLLGLVSYSTEKRTKEVGIRKAMGATADKIIGLFSSETLILILISNTIACPIVILAMNRWLQDFAYKAPIKPQYFILVLFVTSIIAVTTIGYLSVKSARKNPVVSLRYE